jgi:mannosyltransferase OCH1-like enzyme
VVLGAIYFFKDRGGCGSDRDRAAFEASYSGMPNYVPPPHKSFPKIIHQTWKTCDNFALPAHKAFTQSWKDHHPHWQYRCWNDSDNRALIKNHLTQYLDTYDGFPREIYRVDFVRAAYMYVYGGVYVDYDFVSVKPLDPLLELWRPYGVIFGTMGKEEKLSDVSHLFPPLGVLPVSFLFLYLL